MEKRKITLNDIRQTGQGLYRKTIFASKLEKITLQYGWWIPRLISVYITWALLKIFPGIRPNMVTLIMLLVYMAAQYFFYQGALMIGGLVLYFGAILDRVDGEVARMTEIYSFKGIFLDAQSHFISSASFLCIGLGLYMRGRDLISLLLGMICMFLDIHIRYMRTEKEKILFKLNSEEKDIFNIEFMKIKNRYIKKIFSLLCIINREDIIALLMIFFGLISVKYDLSIACFLYFYGTTLLLNSIIIIVETLKESEDRYRQH